MPEGPRADGRLERSDRDRQRSQGDRPDDHHHDPASSEPDGFAQMVEPDPSQDRQPKGDPEGQPSVVGDVEDGQGPQEVIDRRNPEGSHRADRHHPDEEAHAG